MTSHSLFDQFFIIFHSIFQLKDGPRNWCDYTINLSQERLRVHFAIV